MLCWWVLFLNVAPINNAWVEHAILHHTTRQQLCEIKLRAISHYLMARGGWWVYWLSGKYLSSERNKTGFSYSIVYINDRTGESALHLGWRKCLRGASQYISTRAMNHAWNCFYKNGNNSLEQGKSTQRRSLAHDNVLIKSDLICRPHITEESICLSLGKSSLIFFPGRWLEQRTRDAS